MLSEPCIEHVRVWAIWDGVQDHPANVEISIMVQPVPNTRIPVLHSSDPNVKSIRLQRTIRLEKPTIKASSHAKDYKSPSGRSNEGLSDFDAAETQLIGSPVDNQPRSIRRHIFPRVKGDNGLAGRENSSLLMDLDLALFEGNAAARYLEANPSQDVLPATVPEGRSAMKLLETPSHTNIGDNRSLRDDMGPTLSVVEDPKRSDRIRFVVLPDNRRSASGSTAEISLPSGPSSTIGEGDMPIAGDDMNASTNVSLNWRAQYIDSKGSPIEGLGDKAVTRRPDARMCDSPTKSGCSKTSALLEVKNPPYTSPQESRTNSRKTASHSKKAPWKSPSQEDNSTISKAPSGKVGSFRQSAKESYQPSCAQQGRLSRSAAASPRPAHSEKAQFSGRNSRAIGRSSGNIFNIFRDGSCPDEITSPQRKPRPSHPWGSEGQSTSPQGSSDNQPDRVSSQFTPADAQGVLEAIDKLQSQIGEDFELDLLSPVRKEWACPIEEANEALLPRICPSSASVLLYDSDSSGSPNSVQSRTFGPFTVVKDGVLFVCFPDQCEPTTLQLEFEAVIAVTNVGRNHWCSFEIQGLPWSEETISRAALIIEDGYKDAIFQFQTPTFDENFIRGSNSSVIGRFDHHQPMRVLFRKKLGVQRLEDFEVVIETSARFTYDLLSGIKAHYTITLYVRGPGGHAVDTYADRVCTEFTIRNGPKDVSAYSGKEQASLQFLPGEQLDETGGRNVVVMCDPAEVGCPITIYFSMALDDSSQALELPVIQPTPRGGRVMIETISIEEALPPLRADFSLNSTQLDWLHTKHSASNTTPVLHEFLRSSSLEKYDSGLRFILLRLRDYPFHDILLNTRDRLASINSLSVVIYEAPRTEMAQCGQSLFECEMLLDYEIQRRQPQELIAFVANGWRPSFAIVDGRVAQRGQFYETEDGEVAFLLNGRAQPGTVVSLKLYWTTRPDSHEGSGGPCQQSELKHHIYELPWVVDRSVYRISARCDIDNAMVAGRGKSRLDFRYPAVKGLVRKLPFMFFDPYITLEVPCKDFVESPEGPEEPAMVLETMAFTESIEPMAPVDHRLRNSHRRSLWKISTGNAFLILIIVFYVTSWLRFIDRRELAPEKTVFVDYLNVPGRTAAYSNISPITAKDREDDGTLVQADELVLLEDGEFHPNGFGLEGEGEEEEEQEEEQEGEEGEQWEGEEGEEDRKESKSGDGFAISIGRVFYGIRGY
ncbi:MAG: hypothetical protein M1840_007258 [Geoglossum simile]|nr:MAG: hypothetical protein M1840_007258 [Geoglossum simile]